MALIVEDIIRDENLGEDFSMVWVGFEDTNQPYVDDTAYAFKDRAVEEELRSQGELDDAKVIDGVYVIKSRCCF